MSPVSKLITELHSALATYPAEHKLLELIDGHLRGLRAIYRLRREEFTDETMLFLKSLHPIQDALREFIESVEEKDWVRTCDDAQELASRFGELAERLAPHLVAKRAEKEMRELAAKAKSLPFASIAAGETAFNHRRIKMETSAASCPKCGSKMVLRESQHGYFWGCSKFPLCFSKRWLSTTDFEYLFHS